MATLENNRSEKILVGLLFLLGFLTVGITSVFTSTAANTLFLSHYDASALAFCYLGFAVVTPFVGTCYLRMQARLQLRALIIAALIADGLVLLIFRLAFFLGWDQVFSFGLKIWYDAELVLTSIVFWGLCNQLLTVRQGKRLFGIIGAGDPLAVLIGGAAIPLLLTWLKPADLLILSAVGPFAAIAVVWIILGRYTPPQQTTEDDDESLAQRQDIRSLLQNPYVLLIFATGFLSLTCYFLVDNAFYAETKKRFPQEYDLARFLGLYMAVAGAVSLINALFVTGPLVSRLGIRVGLMTLPVALFVFSMVAVVAGMSSDAGPFILFACMTASRALDFALRGTVDKSSMLAIYQPFLPATRLRVQTAVETMIEPATAVVAGIGLLVAMNIFGWGAPQLAVLIVCVALGWIGTLLFLHRQYLLELARALIRRNLGRVSLETGEHTAILERGLASTRAGEVLYCLSLLTSSARPPPHRQLLQLLDHPSADVRRSAAAAMEHLPDPAFVTAIRHHLGDCDDPKLKSALLSALLACAPNEINEFAPFLQADSATCNGAMVALLKHGGLEGALLAGERLLEAIRSQDIEERKQAASVLGAVQLPLYHRLLARLLNDPDLSVRTVALKAASRVAAPALWPIVLAQLGIESLERAAQGCLITAGEQCLPAIDTIMAHPETSSRIRLRITEVLGRLGGPEGFSRLISQFEHGDRQMRLAQCAALHQCQHGCPPAAAEFIWKQIESLAQSAAWALAASADLPAELRLLDAVRRSLHYEVEKSVAAIFHLLSCLYSRSFIDDARECIAYGPADKRAYALEALEQCLPKSAGRWLMALFEPASAEERRLRLTRYFPNPSLPSDERLMDILTRNDRVGSWTAAVTLFALLKLKVSIAVDKVALASRFDSAAVHEVLSKMGEPAARHSAGGGSLR